MAPHQRFSATTLDDLRREAEELGIALPVSDQVTALAGPVQVGTLRVPNRLAVLPMEGCDGTRDGAPGALTLRRYDRFAAGGAGLLWLEACAVAPEGRANPHQLWLTRENLGAFAAMVERIHAVARDAMGNDFRPILILQLTHSGRYSKPDGVPAPMFAHHSPLSMGSHLGLDHPLVSDAYLDELQGAYLATARLAREAGIDAVDIKACHRYLVSELLASHTRVQSRYGGTYENRTRLLRETVAAIRRDLPDLPITTRLNLSDCYAYPFGWGMHPTVPDRVDLTEPLRLVGELHALGVSCVSTSMGNPYYLAHFGRPFDKPAVGAALPEEHPLQSMFRLIDATRQVQQAYPDLAVLGGGYSWVRHLFPQLAAGLITQGWSSLVGLGRGAFAYPDFARDILTTGAMDARQCCIACSGCTQIMRDGGMSGCLVRDAAVYGPIYRAGRARAIG